MVALILSVKSIGHLPLQQDKGHAVVVAVQVLVPAEGIAPGKGLPGGLLKDGEGLSGDHIPDLPLLLQVGKIAAGDRADLSPGAGGTVSVDDLQHGGDDALEHVVLVVRIAFVFLLYKLIQIGKIDLERKERLIVATLRHDKRYDKMHPIDIFYIFGVKSVSHNSAPPKNTYLFYYAQE